MANRTRDTANLVSANNLYVDISTDKVGIGTTTPTSKLTVVGDVRVSGASTFVGLVELDSSLRDFNGSVGAAGSVLISTVSGVSWSAPAGGGGGGESYWIQTSAGIHTLSNVGIGTTNPTEKLTVVGTSIIGNLTITPVGTGATVGGVGVVTYHGDGSKLTGIISGLGGIGTAGGTVGTGITFLDFRGSGISSVTASAGIATITVSGSGAGASRSVTSYTATENQTSFAATYSVGYADVYLNGSKLSSTEYTASNGTSIELTEGASLNDIVEIVSYIINILDISPVMMGMIF